MKLKNSFITHETDGEQILIDTASNFAGLVRSNPTAAFIVDCLKTETNEDEILNKMQEKYEGDPQIMSGDLRRVIDKLRKIGAIDE